MAPYAAYAAEIYRGGQPPALPTDPDRLEAAAQAALPPQAFWYAAGGAGSGATMRANRAAFDRYGLVPRMLRDNTARDWSTTVLGTAMPAPLLLAPIGVQSILHPDGELATARAAAALGLPMRRGRGGSFRQLPPAPVVFPAAPDRARSALERPHRAHRVGNVPGGDRCPVPRRQRPAGTVRTDFRAKRRLTVDLRAAGSMSQAPPPTSVRNAA
jgi:hypothetical protein